MIVCYCCLYGCDMLNYYVFGRGAEDMQWLIVASYLSRSVGADLGHPLGLAPPPPTYQIPKQIAIGVIGLANQFHYSLFGGGLLVPRVSQYLDCDTFALNLIRRGLP